MGNDPKEERRQEILMAALKAFAEKGYNKTTVEDIVRISGLSKGTLYWYFQNKEAIFLGLVEMVFSGFWQMFEGILRETTDIPPPERLRLLLNATTTTIDESIQWIGLYTDFFNQAWQIPRLLEIFRQFYAQYTGAVAPIIQQGIDSGIFREVDPQLAARTLVGALDGYWFQQILQFGDARQLIDLYGDLVVKGLMKGDGKDD